MYGHQLMDCKLLNTIGAKIFPNSNFKFETKKLGKANFFFLVLFLLIYSMPQKHNGSEWT
jgi:hypothetical protein